MKRFSPGASVNSDYYNYCNCCEIDDGRPTLVWDKDNFALCFECLQKLSEKYLYQNLKLNEQITIKRKPISEKLRNKLLKKYKYKCVKCGNTKNLQIDHIKPFSLGGETKLKNLQILRKNCNSKKRNND